MPREYSSGVCHSLLRDSERARLTCTQYIRLLMLQKLLLKSEIYAHAQTVFTRLSFRPPQRPGYEQVYCT